MLKRTIANVDALIWIIGRDSMVGFRLTAYAALGVIALALIH